MFSMCTYLYYSTGSEETCWYCSNCDYSATTASNLKRRVKNKHKEVRYPCSRWEHGATDTGNLKKHVENNHEGVRHPYDQTLLIPMIGSCWVHSLSVHSQQPECTTRAWALIFVLSAGLDSRPLYARWCVVP